MFASQRSTGGKPAVQFGMPRYIRRRLVPTSTSTSSHQLTYTCTIATKHAPSLILARVVKEETMGLIFKVICTVLGLFFALGKEP